MEISSSVRMELSPVMREVTALFGSISVSSAAGQSAADETEMESVSPRYTGPQMHDGFCALTLNIGGRNTNAVEFVLEGDASDVGAACTALGARLLEAMGSDTFGPSALGEAERRAVDA